MIDNFGGHYVIYIQIEGAGIMGHIETKIYSGVCEFVFIKAICTLPTVCILKIDFWSPLMGT